MFIYVRLLQRMCSYIEICFLSRINIYKFMFACGDPLVHFFPLPYYSITHLSSAMRYLLVSSPFACTGSFQFIPLFFLLLRMCQITKYTFFTFCSCEHRLFSFHLFPYSLTTCHCSYRSPSHSSTMLTSFSHIALHQYKKS